MNGSGDGPSLWIAGCEHGDEYLAAATIIEFIAQLDPEKVKGQVVAFPVLDSTAFNIKERFSPIDHYDFSRAYPGFRNGWLAQQIAFQFIELASKRADYALDMHNGIHGVVEVSPYCVVNYETEEQWKSMYQGFVESFLTEKIVHWFGTSTERGARTSMMNNALMHKGIPCYVPEIGPDLKTGMPHGIRGLQNTMKYLEMLDGRPEKLEKYRNFPDVLHVFPTRGGVFKSYVELNEEVKEGQKLASIRSFYGEITEELVAPAAGVIVARWLIPVIGTGDFSAFQLAPFKPFDRPWPGER